MTREELHAMLEHFKRLVEEVASKNDIIREYQEKEEKRKENNKTILQIIKKILKRGK